MTLVSVIIPTYNRPDHLIDAVNSVYQQTHNNLELIIVDDASNTPAEDVLSNIDSSRFSNWEIITHDTNMGANTARNNGIQRAEGNYIAFLDDDDLWEQEKIEIQLQKFNDSESDVGMVYTGKKYIDSDGSVTRIRCPETRGWVTENILCGAPLSPFSATMVKSEVIEEAGLPDEKLPSWQDKEWYIRISTQYIIEAIPRPLVISKKFTENSIGDNYIEKRDVSYEMILNKHSNLAQKYNCEKGMISSFSRLLAKSALMNGFYKDAVKLSIKSIAYNPRDISNYPILFSSIGGEYSYKFARYIRNYGGK